MPPTDLIVGTTCAWVRVALRVEDERVVEAASWCSPVDAPATHVVRPGAELGDQIGHIVALDGADDGGPRGYWTVGEAVAAMWEATEARVVDRAPVPLVHAAAVEVVVPDQGWQAVALVAASGVGKTTLALAATNRGARFLTDELVAIAGRAALDPLTRPAHIRAPSPIPLPAAWRTVDSGRHLVTGPPEPVAAGARPARAVVFLQRDPAAPTGLTRLSPAATARRLVEASHNVVALGWAGLTDVATFAEAVPGWHLGYPDADAALDLLEATALAPARTTEPGPSGWIEVPGHRARRWSFAGSALVVDADRGWVVAVEDVPLGAELPAPVVAEISELVGGRPW